MGNVDTVRKVVKGTKAVRGPDSGPGSLMWTTFIGYVLYQSFRIYQYAQLHTKLQQMSSLKQLQQEQKQIIMFRGFLFRLSSENVFGEMVMNHFFQA